MTEKVDHGSNVYGFKNSCQCKKCQKKRDAIRKMVDSMGYIPYGWLEHIKEGLGVYFTDPMWGTIWLAGDNKGCFENIMKEYNLDDEDALTDGEGEETAQLIMDGVSLENLECSPES